MTNVCTLAIKIIWGFLLDPLHHMAQTPLCMSSKILVLKKSFLLDLLRHMARTLKGLGALEENVMYALLVCAVILNNCKRPCASAATRTAASAFSLDFKRFPVSYLCYWLNDVRQFKIQV